MPTGLKRLNVNQDLRDVAKLGGIVNFKNIAIPAISQTLPISAGSIVAHDFADDTADAAWIDRQGHTSWEKEARHTGSQFMSAAYANDAAALAANSSIVSGDLYLNSTSNKFVEYTTGAIWTRGSQRKMPIRRLVTAEADRVIIWDITGGQATMWMVFNGSWSWATGTMLVVANATSSPISSVRMLGHKLIVGSRAITTSSGLFEIDFVTDRCIFRNPNISNVSNHPGVSFRNATLGVSRISTGFGLIINERVNDVAITFLPDAPLDEFGMKIPTIAVATAGGVSIIKDDGNVVNSAANPWSVPMYYSVRFMDGYIFAESQNDHARVAVFRLNGTILFSTGDIPASGIMGYNLLNLSNNNMLEVSGNSLFNYSSGGLQIIRPDYSDPHGNMLAAITNAYSTGYQVGASLRAISYDSNSILADRSVKASTGVVEVGTLTKTPHAGGRTSVSGFSATNYIQEPNATKTITSNTVAGSTVVTVAAHGYTTGRKVAISGSNSTPSIDGIYNITVIDANTFSIPITVTAAGTAGSVSDTDWATIGTGDFSITMTGVKWGQNSVRCICSFGDNASLNSVQFIISQGGFYIAWHNGTSFIYGLAPGGAIHNDVDAHILEIRRKSSVVYFTVDGVVAHSGSYPHTLPTVGALSIGAGWLGILPWIGGSFETFNISATATSPEQAKFIAAQEKAIQGGKPCLLSNSSNVSALEYDAKHDVYKAQNGTNTDLFHGLERIDSKLTTAADFAGKTPVLALSGNTLNVPALDINSEIAAITNTPKQEQTFYFNGDGALTTFKLQKGWKPKAVLLSGLEKVQGAADDWVTNFDGFIDGVTFAVAPAAGTNNVAIRGVQK